MPRDVDPDAIPVTLLTGFLGSGKTTLLNHLVQQPEMADALVIINEFGEMPLDHRLVSYSTENVVMEMSSGCLCCTIRHDLARTLRDVAWRFARGGTRQFSRVVIETTGLSDPAPILHTLMTHPRVADRYRLDGIVATLDQTVGLETLDRHPEAVKQVAMADCVLLTKPDRVTIERRAALMARLRSLNPAAPCHEVTNGAMSPGRLLGLGLFSEAGKIPDVRRWLREEAYAVERGDHAHDHHDHDHDHDHDHHHHHPHHDINRHDDHIRAFCYAFDEPIPEDVFESWLEVLMGFAGRDVLRVKGILDVAGRDAPLAVQGVQHIFYPPVALPGWPDDDRRSRLVFITRDIGREVIDATLRLTRDAVARLPEQDAAPSHRRSTGHVPTHSAPVRGEERIQNES